MSCDGETDLCLENPGYEVDLLVQSSLRAMTAVWICEKTLDQAIRGGEVKVLGPAKLRDRLPDLLQASALSRLGAESMVSEQ